MDEFLLGFHLRMLPKFMDKWGSLQRATFLLREDISVPLSVDDNVWPYYKKEDLLTKVFVNYYGGPYEDNVPNGLELFCIKNHILVAESIYDDAFLIGIAIVNDPSGIAQHLQDMHKIENIQYTVNDLQKAGWNCLGYDIADDWLTSGLMNTGYSKEDKAVLSGRFADDLNEFSLFNSLDAAQSFRAESDKRVPEHAPFMVYGIWAKGRPTVD